MGKVKKYLIDSNIFIYHLNKDKIATDFLLNNVEVSAISRITFIEVLSFNFSSKEEEIVRDYLNNFMIIDTDEEISLQAVKNRNIKKIKLPDNIISATAQLNDLILVTRNTKDFKYIHVDVLNPFE